MTPNKVLALKSYEIKSSDIFFFDNNVWLYMFCPLGNFNKAKKQAGYSGFFEYVLQRKNPIYINSLILSEFANTYLRLDYKLINNMGATVYRDFKADYLTSNDFKTTVKAVSRSLQQIVGCCTRGNDEFQMIDINGIIALSESMGFNDSYYLTLAKMKNFIIVSDDGDFKKQSIPGVGATILTL